MKNEMRNSWIQTPRPPPAPPGPMVPMVASAVGHAPKPLGDRPRPPSAGGDPFYGQSIGTQ